MSLLPGELAAEEEPVDEFHREAVLCGVPCGNCRARAAEARTVLAGGEAPATRSDRGVIKSSRELACEGPGVCGPSAAGPPAARAPPAPSSSWMERSRSPSSVPSRSPAGASYIAAARTPQRPATACLPQLRIRHPPLRPLTRL